MTDEGILALVEAECGTHITSLTLLGVLIPPFSLSLFSSLEIFFSRHTQDSKVESRTRHFMHWLQLDVVPT